MGSDGENGRWRRTTILAVRRGDRVAVGGDGQVTLGQTVLKGDAIKLRRLLDGEVLVGFAGSTADAFALFERLEGKLRDAKGNLQRAAVELAKEWRTDRALRRLEAMLITASAEHLFVLSGTGDVLSPSDGILGIGSGGPFAVAAARALARHTELSAPEIVRTSLSIAGELCIYSNQNIVVEELPCRT